ncbi:protein MAIN-LIKE 1-like [Cryptomeria japonica]|uniref:protein MAIN-LIKE 1-like n=1 Tax=Cryptomeria japonica TaxID=3369 RepID=UPI0027DA99D0|nr:protein MAIN-LIKE 1-like [Cryptomeria japonica]
MAISIQEHHFECHRRHNRLQNYDPMVWLPDILFRCVYPPMMGLVRVLSYTDKNHIDLCGFGHLLQMPDIRVNHRMLTALAEQFHLEHNTFHLPVGEMTITPEDVYQILKIPFAGDKVDYDSAQWPGILALRCIFHKETILERAITWDVMMARYSEQFSLACVLAGIIGCFVMPNRGQQGFLCGWARMLERLLTLPERLGWGSCLLAYMYHKMHEVAYRDGKSMAARVLVLQIWAWEHIPVCRSIVDDAREPHQPIVYCYSGYVTQPHLSKTKY